MKKIYELIHKMVIVLLLVLIPAYSWSQEKGVVSGAPENPASSGSYWSVGAFGGLMQFNGDLSKNLWLNLSSNSIGYDVGLVATRQFNDIIGARIRLAYGAVKSGVENKYTWDFEGGNGTPGYVTQSFETTLYETDLQLTVNWLNMILGTDPGRLVSSYVIAGIGIDQATGTKRDDLANMEVATLGDDATKLNMGNNSGLGGSNLQYKVGAGLGFDFNINRNFSVPVEFYWRWQNSDLLDMTRGGAEEVFNDMYSSGTIGLTYKFGYKDDAPPAAFEPMEEKVYVPAPKVVFSVTAPRNIPAQRQVREIFPVRNYVFFDAGSTEIPERYILLQKDQVKDFREDQQELATGKRLTSRSARQMTVYYNVLNILGDRMLKSPSSTVKLVGSSGNGSDDGKMMAESVKTYLVTVFGINASRISTEGREKPKIPSEQPGGELELELLREGDRRVSIESSSPALLMEFRSGPDAPLKPVEFKTLQEAPIDSYVTFLVDGGTVAFNSWSLDVIDDKGVHQSFGPYSQDKILIQGKSILGTRPEGDFKVIMTGLAKNGEVVKKEARVHMVLWTPSAVEEGMRFSILFEFDESRVIGLYDRYLTDVVAPKIPGGGKVIIHGHTDNIGDPDYNKTLSGARAAEVKGILESALLKAGKTGVEFETHGFGEDTNFAPYENEFPEERFYNRTVIIDIYPQK